MNIGLEHGEPDAFTIYGTQLANVRINQGRVHELKPMLEQALADNPALYTYRAVLTVTAARAGDQALARAMLAEDHAKGFSLPEDTGWSTGIITWAEAAAIAGAVDVAPVLRERMLPHHDQITTTSITFSCAFAHYLGLLDHLLGRHDEAERWFAEALGLHEQVRAPILTSRTQAAWAALLVDRARGDDHDRARLLATTALETAEGGGYGYVERDARAVLGRLP